MKEPGLDNRHRDQAPPKTGEIQQKRGDTLNKNLSRPIREFSPKARLDTMRKEQAKSASKQYVGLQRIDIKRRRKRKCYGEIYNTRAIER
jgi:hypothetical protein